MWEENMWNSTDSNPIHDQTASHVAVSYLSVHLEFKLSSLHCSSLQSFYKYHISRWVNTVQFEPFFKTRFVQPISRIVPNIILTVRDARLTASFISELQVLRNSGHLSQNMSSPFKLLSTVYLQSTALSAWVSQSVLIHYFHTAWSLKSQAPNKHLCYLLQHCATHHQRKYFMSWFWLDSTVQNVCWTSGCISYINHLNFVVYFLHVLNQFMS